MLAAIGCGIQALMDQVFLPNKIKTRGELHGNIRRGARWRDHATTLVRQGLLVESYRHVNRVGPRHHVMTVGPGCHVMMVGHGGRDPLVGP